MFDTQWDPLVEFLFKSPECTANVFCLCSRSFSRTREDPPEERSRQLVHAGDEISASESDYREDEYLSEENCINDHEDQLHTQSELKLETDAEIVSCYCSASHTDNISTDEHDSIRDSHSTRLHTHRGLQSSDSGADLTEHIRNDPEAAWHKFWANHGERLIWDSWITKYSDYINPEYLAVCETESNDAHAIDADAKEDPHAKAEHSKFSFEKKDLDKVEPNLSIIEENKVLKDKADTKTNEVIHRNRALIRNLSTSDSFDKLNADISEGWNPLSPLSIDCETEAERLLLSSRCGSYASGSLRTVDSMTNVTRMTVSSIDLSDSSKNSESFSSVSSVQSSLSSTSSEDLEENGDYNSQWNHLWKKHYEDEYLHQYKKFMSIQTGKIDLNESVDGKSPTPHLNAHVLQSFNKTLKERKNSNNSSFEEASDSGARRRKPRKSVDAVSALLETIKVEDTPAVISEIDAVDYVEEVDEETLKSLGLPTTFTKKRITKKQLSKSLSSFSSLDSDGSTQSLSDRIKAAFNLIALEHDEGSRPKLIGKMDFKMRHIRLQNRHLKLMHPPERPVHKYFDDDGNEIVAEKETEMPMVQVDAKSTTSSDNLLSPESAPDLLYSIVNEKMAGLKKNRRKQRKKKVLPPLIKGKPKLRKYYDRRFSLFSKFDDGIILDEESWYSVTPENVAKHIADRCKCNIIIDAFCGAGGNSIQFAMTCTKVIAIDIDPKKIELAQNNAKIYNVQNRIEFIVGDFFALAPYLKADVVFLSPPWGGPDYLKLKIYDLETMLQPFPLSQLLNSARVITKNIALFLPRNSETYNLITEAGPGGSVELEQNFLNKKLIALTAYYNELLRKTE